MKIRTSLLAAASAIALVVGLAAPAGAATTINVANDTITCNSVVGTLKFTPGLTLYSGPTDTTPAGSIAVKTTLGGCSTSAATAVQSGAGATAKLAPITSAHSSCNGLSGLSTSTSGDLITKWKTVTGQPKITPTATTMHIAQTNGGTFNDGGVTTPASDKDSWGAQYGIFMIGHDAAHGNTTAPTVTGAFTGGDSGHNSTIDATTGQSKDYIALLCLLGPVKALNFGIGGATLA